MKIPPQIAPIKIAILPLTKKDGLPKKAKEIMNSFKGLFSCQYEEKDSIGKRYRRQDAIGTPFCITVDHESIKKNSVTIRNRDTMSQERININELNSFFSKKLTISSLL